MLPTRRHNNRKRKCGLAVKADGGHQVISGGSGSLPTPTIHDFIGRDDGRIVAVQVGEHGIEWVSRESI